MSAGSGRYRATAIGADSYAARLAEEARRFKLAGSELKAGVNVILRWLTVIIPPAAGLLLLRLLGTEDRWQKRFEAPSRRRWRWFPMVWCFSPACLSSQE